MFLFSIALYQAKTLANCFPPSPILFTLCGRHFFFHIFSIMSSPNDKIYTCKNIKSYVSLILDLEGMNYDLWRELFKTNCIRYVVSDHLDDTSNKPADKEMCKVYSINKKLLFCTFLNFIIQADCIASRYRKALKTSFVTIKKPMDLDNELRNIVLGDSSVIKYCTQIKTIFDLLSNIKALILNMPSMVFLQILIT